MAESIADDVLADPEKWRESFPERANDTLTLWNEWRDLRKQALCFVRECSGLNDLEYWPAAIKSADQAVLRLFQASNSETMQAVGELQDTFWALDRLREQCQLEQESGPRSSHAKREENRGRKTKRSTTNGDAKESILGEMAVDDDQINRSIDCPPDTELAVREAGIGSAPDSPTGFLGGAGLELTIRPIPKQKGQ